MLVTRMAQRQVRIVGNVYTARDDDVTHEPSKFVVTNDYLLALPLTCSARPFPLCGCGKKYRACEATWCAQALAGALGQGGDGPITVVGVIAAGQGAAQRARRGACHALWVPGERVTR